MNPALESLTRLLRQEIGLDVDSVGINAVDHVMRVRMRATHCTTPEEYLAQLNTSEERTQFIEAVVVPETWFFRQQEAFEALLRYVEKQWMPRHAGRPLNILSAPCSTGEEPYSIAMTLVDAGFPPPWINLHAVDISGRALARAREGLYHEYSFRRRELEFRERHFRAEGRGFRLDPGIRSLVQFQRGNLLNRSELALPAALDVVFCRNLLIYLDTEAQDQLVTRLFAALVPGGMFVCGPAESSIVARHRGAIGAGFGVFSRPFPGEEKRSPVQQNSQQAETSGQMGNAHRSGISRSAWPAPGEANGATVKKARSFFPAPATHRFPEHSRPATPLRSVHSGTGAVLPSGGVSPADARPAHENPMAAETLEHAQAHADAGRLTRAIDICRQFLASNPHSVAGHYLQGLLHDAAGHRTTAAANYRRALYLDPEHVDALLHLASLVALQGDKSQAEQLRQRAARAGSRLASREVKGA